MGVLPSGVFVMALLAQSPPVIPVPEQVRITTVRNCCLPMMLILMGIGIR